VLETQKADSINPYFEESINEVSIVFSDKSKSNVHISDFVEAHYTEKSIKETTNSSLKWVHIAISNEKRNFLGVYQKIEGKYLQLYLNEFCYKLNHRYFANRLFDSLSIALACS
jgi:transposase-like protein|tara:strand:- start:50 stop:391 length:342 start_codon:yes stop_codon:yes gene_type:complete